MARAVYYYDSICEKHNIVSMKLKCKLIVNSYYGIIEIICERNKHNV